MQIDLKHKRQSAGFIRTSSSKALPSFKIDSQNNSSDDFSSFENDKKAQDSEASFSPYKHPNQYLSKPPISTYNQNHRETQPVFHNDRLKSSYWEEEKKRKQRTLSTQKHKNILIRRAEVENELAQIDKICSEIGQLQGPHSFKNRYERMVREKSPVSFAQDDEQKEKRSRKLESSKKKQKKYNYDVSDEKQMRPNRPQTSHAYISSSHNKPKNDQIENNSKYKFEEVSNISEHSQQETQYSKFKVTGNQNHNKKITNHSQFDHFGSFGTNKSSNIQNKQPNFVQQKNYQQQSKSRPYKQDFIKKQHDKARTRFISQRQQSPSESEQPEEDDEVEVFEDNDESLIQDYGKEEFKKNLKECVQQNNRGKEAQAGLYKTKGGICFDLDVNQFTQKQPIPQTKPNLVSLPRKAKKVNTKEQLLKRRQMAKNYDKQARARVFGAY